MKSNLLKVLVLIICILVQSCQPTQVVSTLYAPGKFKADSKSKFLKVHIKDGSLYVLNDWVNDSIDNVIYGQGNYYNFKRDIISFKPKTAVVSDDSHFKICYDDISLIETNLMKFHGGKLASITIVGVPLSVFATYCIINPKACFGSCPTFYTMNNGKWNLAAEGFSSSILPVFEKKDIDMLYWTKNEENKLTIKLTNEALETHVIRYANLLVFPHEEGKRVFAATDGEFYSTQNQVSPVKCSDENNNCLEKVEKMDHIERFSMANSENLARKEELIFSFANQKGMNSGLIIGSRQTLLTTYLFYQGLAYSGNYAGYFAASIENGNKQIKNHVQKLWDKLGGIEVYLKNQSGNWEKIYQIDEMGPIATDVHLIKLPQDIPANATLKLKMTQGLWRIDYLALTEVLNPVSPVTIQPHEVIKDGKSDDEALRLLNDTTSYFITWPGDAYLLNYKLPGESSYELFLQTKGYYLEWMRDEWLAEQDVKKARFMFAFPGLYMRKAAGEFKKSEAEMENVFWGSRYVQN